MMERLIIRKEKPPGVNKLTALLLEGPHLNEE